LGQVVGRGAGRRGAHHPAPKSSGTDELSVLNEEVTTVKSVDIIVCLPVEVRLTPKPNTRLSTYYSMWLNLAP